MSASPESSGQVGTVSIRVVIPYHLRNLAGVGAEISLDVAAPVTIGHVLDALEARYPMLRGTVREYETGKRRAFLRFFACEEDLSHVGMDAELPEPVVKGREPFLIIGAIAGGTRGQGTRKAKAREPRD